MIIITSSDPSLAGYVSVTCGKYNFEPSCRHVLYAFTKSHNYRTYTTSDYGYFNKGKNNPLAWKVTLLGRWDTGTPLRRRSNSPSRAGPGNKHGSPDRRRFAGFYRPPPSSSSLPSLQRVPLLPLQKLFFRFANDYPPFLVNPRCLHVLNIHLYRISTAFRPHPGSCRFEMHFRTVPFLL